MEITPTAATASAEAMTMEVSYQAAHGDMWNRGETRDRSELPGRTPSRPCEKSSRAAAAWMASVQLMKASTITSSANLCATFPKDAANTVLTGSASAPLVTAVMLG